MLLWLVVTTTSFIDLSLPAASTSENSAISSTQRFVAENDDVDALPSNRSGPDSPDSNEFHKLSRTLSEDLSTPQLEDDLPSNEMSEGTREHQHVAL